MVVIQDIVERDSIESQADSQASDLFSIAVFCGFGADGVEAEVRECTADGATMALARMMPSSCAKRAPRPAGSGAFTEFSVILPRAAATSNKKEQPDALPNSGRR